MWRIQISHVTSGKKGHIPIWCRINKVRLNKFYSIWNNLNWPHNILNIWWFHFSSLISPHNNRKWRVRCGWYHVIRWLFLQMIKVWVMIYRLTTVDENWTMAYIIIIKDLLFHYRNHSHYEIDIQNKIILLQYYIFSSILNTSYLR